MLLLQHLTSSEIELSDRDVHPLEVGEGPLQLSAELGLGGEVIEDTRHVTNLGAPPLSLCGAAPLRVRGG